MNNDTPYAELDPNLILDAVESLGLRCDGNLLALNSYENRVYQVGIEDAAPMIAKFYRPKRWDQNTILEEHQFALELASHEIPVVAPWQASNQHTLHHYHDFGFALFPRCSGRPLEVDSLDQLEWMGRFIGRMHAVGACRPFVHRPQLTLASHGYAAFDFLMDNQFIPAYLVENYRYAAQAVLQKIEQCFAYVGDVRSLRLHGDMHAGNVLWNNNGPHIVDLDDSMMGPAVQDIWMLLAGDQAQVELQLERILTGYREFHEFNQRELYLIEALRTLRQLHYSAWLAKRWQDPAFPLSFPWFNTPRYWEEQIQNLAEQTHLLNQLV